MDTKQHKENFMPNLKYYGSFERGNSMSLGEGVGVQFGTNAMPTEDGDMFLAILDADNPKDQERMKLIEKSKPFLKGKIKYIPNAEEMAEKGRLIKAEEKLNMIKEGMTTGLFDFKMPQDEQELRDFAYSIGVDFDIEKKIPKPVLAGKVKEKLGLAEPKPPKEPVKYPKRKSKEGE